MKALELIQSANLNGIVIEGSNARTENASRDVLVTVNGRCEIHFLTFDNEHSKYIPRYTQLKKISFPENTDNVQTFISNDLKLKAKSVVDRILGSQESSIKEIYLSDSEITKVVEDRILRISISQFDAVVVRANKINTEGNKLRTKLVNFMSNKASEDFFNEEKTKRTLSSKGEFNFLIERFHLPTKQKSADFKKYLSSQDISSLETFTKAVIEKEVFSPEFLKQLDDYFIREKLAHIISLGKKIINLGSTDLSTAKAQEVIEQLEIDSVSQLETLWQRYFEKYLLFLIFSYRKIYSKIELDTPYGNRYPDFVGLNHFGGVDIIEIKTHLKHALVYDKSHGNYAFSSEMSKAIIQTTNYIDAIVQEKIIVEENGINIIDDIKKEVFAENLHYPKGIIIISSKTKLVRNISSHDLKKIERDLTKLRNSLKNIEILTFDEIIQMADRYLNNITSN